MSTCRGSLRGLTELTIQSPPCYVTLHYITLYIDFTLSAPLQSVTFVLISIRTNIRIYSFQENDTNQHPNIFVWNFLTQTNIRIYSYPKNDTNEYPNKYSDQKYSNIRIFEYIRHTLLCTLFETATAGNGHEACKNVCLCKSVQICARCAKLAIVWLLR